MSFLAPAFFLGLTALAVPVLIHLIQRERRRVVPFPSLMFLQRIPYHSVRRRRIRNWLLLLMRGAALALVVFAFARPVFRLGPLAAATAAGAREVVIALDRSASMGYGDQWQKAQEAARQAIARLGGDDRATLVLFAANAEEDVRATSDRARLTAAVNAATVGAGATRFGPALKLAQSVLLRSPLKRREAILISDFQKSGWDGAEDVHFPEGAMLTPVSVASPEAANLSVPSVSFARTIFSGKERIAVTAAIANRGADPVNDLPVTLDVDGEQLQTVPASVAPHASASVVFPPFTLANANVRGTVRAGSDPLPSDNTFRFVLSPIRPIPVLVVDDGVRANASVYLAKALAIGTTPPFDVEIVPVTRAVAASLASRAVVVLNDVPFPGGGFGAALRTFIERGGGLLAVLGEHSTWPDADAPILPGQLAGAIDPASGTSASIGFIDYSHPSLELFKTPRGGGFSGAHIFRYRGLIPAPTDRVLARFDDGGVTAAERRIGDGRAIAWSTTFDDSWNDLPLQPVFLPLVHQLIRYLARYEEPAAWYTVGQAIDLAGRLPRGRAEPIVLTPSGRRVGIGEAEGPSFVELSEQGFYELRTSSGGSGHPFTVAANLDPAESDLSIMDPQELAAAVTGHATADAAADPAAVAQPPTGEEAEHRQALWWYLLVAAALLLAAETVVSNRLRGPVG